MSAVVASEPVFGVAAMDLDLKEHYEIIDGQRVELPPMSAYATRIAFRLAFKVNEFAQAHNLGEAMTETLFRLALPVDRNRRLDAAFVSYARWPRGQYQPMESNAWDVVPDLAIEVISPNDMAEELLEKVGEYFQAGVRLAWVVYPRLRLVYVYESAQKTFVLAKADELDGGSVLPGFRLSLGELFIEERDRP